VDPLRPGRRHAPSEAGSETGTFFNGQAEPGRPTFALGVLAVFPKPKPQWAPASQRPVDLRHLGSPRADFPAGRWKHPSRESRFDDLRWVEGHESVAG